MKKPNFPVDDPAPDPVPVPDPVPDLPPAADYPKRIYLQHGPVTVTSEEDEAKWRASDAEAPETPANPLTAAELVQVRLVLAHWREYLSALPPKALP